MSLAKLPIIKQTISVCNRCGKFIVFDEATRSQRTGRKIPLDDYAAKTPHKCLEVAA
jgi:hypothetical protein